MLILHRVLEGQRSQISILDCIFKGRRSQMLILHCVLEGRRHQMLILHCVSQENDQSGDIWGDLARRCQNSRKRPGAKSLIKSFVKCCAKHDFRPREGQGPFSRSREGAHRDADRRFRWFSLIKASVFAKTLCFMQ